MTVLPHAIPAAGRPPRLVSIRAAEIVFAGFAILFMTGGLTRLLSGGLPEEIARTTSSPLVQIAGALVYCQTAGFLALRMQRYLSLLSRNVILFLPVALAIASTYWSSDPDLTLRRSVSLLGTTLLGVYLGFVRENRRANSWARVPQGLVSALAVSLGIGVLQAANPRLPSPLVGILGVKAYFLYVPLLAVVPAAFPDAKALVGFLRRYLTLAIPVGLLAAIQFVSPPDSRWNTYARSSSPDAQMYAITFGAVERVRVTGPFSFITGYGSYLQAVSLLALALLSVRGWRWRRPACPCRR